MKITEIAFSCYPVTDIPKARAFYEGVLGLRKTFETDLGDAGHWVEYDIGPGTLAIGKSPGHQPSAQGCSVALEVADFPETVAVLQAARVPVRMGPIETPVCHMVLVSDPDGNTVILHKRKPEHE
jgi:predicted enzyme related to lactoylglutathione lyase